VEENPSDFWTLAERYRPYLKRVVARVLGEQLSDKVDASDVVQQGYLEAFRHRSQFRGTSAGEWGAWLMAIVKNEAQNLLRYWRQEMREVGREEALMAGSSDRRQLAGDFSTPSQSADRREQAARLLAALERLPPDYHQVITLRNLQDLPFEAVAASMGRSEMAVRQLWVRAVQRLRQELGGME
jgi:RNA polymerase sigma-70 factor (ECF subfamily)